MEMHNGNGNGDAHAKIDRLLGKVDALIVLQSEQGRQLDGIGERVVKVEEGVSATKDIVQAWGAAKTSFQFLRWVAGLLAAIVGLWAAIRGMQRP